MKIKAFLMMISGLLLTAATVNTAHAACTHAGFCDRPIQMGVSIGNTPSLPFIYAGTAGMRVHPFNNPGLKMILSNNHVLGAVGPNLCPNTADDYPPPMTWALQPGTLDIGLDPGNDSTYVAGVVFRYVPISFTPGTTNLVDAAVAITSTSLTSSSILGLGQPNPALGTAVVGMPVTKSGRTTGVTTSTVLSVNSTIDINYGSCGVARFVNQVITGSGLGDSGDSGSVVLQQGTNIPVGLYFAGSRFTGVMNPILNVYLALSVFVDSETPSTIASEDDLRQASSRLQADPRIEALKAVQARHEAGILSVRGIRGIGIGMDEAGQEPAFIVYAEKLGDRLRSRLPASIEGTRVRLIESGDIIAH
jgi:hypothetical protein